MDGNDKNWTSGRASSIRPKGLNTVSDRDSATGMSNKAFVPGMIPAAFRPITQQGMTGLRPTQTPSGLNRQYHDKRYYMSAIQSHMLLISDEITNLKRQLAENKLDATNYEECKRQVESYKEQLLKHEENLIMYNTAIEISMFKGSKSDVDADAEKLRKANQQRIAQLESIFSDKLAREEQLAKLQQQIEIEEQLFNDVIAQLSEEERQEYNELWAKNEQYKKDEEYLRGEIEKLKNTINMHEQHVIQNEAKRVRYNLMVKYNEFTRRRNKIIEENKIKRTPSQEREHLLEQVKQDRLDMESIRIQEDEYKNDIIKLRERLAELEDELSERNSARLNKYRELLKKQETMESFLSTYDDIYQEEVKKLNELRSNIVFSLEYTSGDSADINIEEMENTKNYEVNPNATKDELKEEYKKLTAQLKMLTSVNERFQNELATFKEQQDTYETELKTYNNIDMARDDLIDRQQNLENQKDSLKKVLQATKSAVAEAEKRQNELNNQLKYNEVYKEMITLEDKLAKLKLENEKHRTMIDNIKMMDNYEQYRNDAIKFADELLIDIEKSLSEKK